MVPSSMLLLRLCLPALVDLRLRPRLRRPPRRRRGLLRARDDQRVVRRVVVVALLLRERHGRREGEGCKENGSEISLWLQLKEIYNR